MEWLAGGRGGPPAGGDHGLRRDAGRADRVRARRGGRRGVLGDPPAAADPAVLGERARSLLRPGGGRLADPGRDPERAAIYRRRPRRCRPDGAAPEPRQLRAAEGRELGARDRAHDRAAGRRGCGLQRPRRARAARLPARGLRRHDPGTGMLRRAGADLRGHAQRRGRGGGAALPRHPAAHRLHHAVHRSVPMLRQAGRRPATGPRPGVRPAAGAGADPARARADGAPRRRPAALRRGRA